jgi:hypothetical protein
VPIASQTKNKKNVKFVKEQRNISECTPLKTIPLCFTDESFHLDDYLEVSTLLGKF